MRSHCLVLVVLFHAATLCAAQTDTSAAHADSLLKIANRYLSRQSPDTARRIFQQLLDAQPQNRQARTGIVQAALAQGEWGDAKDVCDDLLDRNPNDVAAHYYAGICQRELGTERGGPLRKMAWAKSREHFQTAIAADSLFQDVLYQFARLKEYNDEWPEALALAHRQVQLRPEEVDAQLGLLHMYRHYIAVTSPDDALALLQSRGDDYGLYFGAEVLRRTKRFEEAEPALLQLLTHHSPVPPEAIYLSLARICTALHDDPRALSLYWKAVDGITSWLGAALIFEDFKYIITDRELREYRSLSSDRHKISFFQRFWRLRDPMPAAALNYRLIEHMHRLMYAEEAYEYYGFRTGFSNPDQTQQLTEPRAFFLNKEFNDLGMIYLRQGSPQRVEQTMGNGSTFGPTAVDPHQAWIYGATSDQPQRIFHFALHNSSSNNWRLTPLPGTPERLDNDMVADLSMYDTRYYRLSQGDPLESMKLVAELETDAETTVTNALTTDRYVIGKGTTAFILPHSIDAFRGSTGRSLIDVSYAIPFAPLRQSAGSETTRVRLEAGISTISPDGRMLGSKLDTLDLPLTQDGTGSYIGLFRQLVLPESIRVTIQVRGLNVATMASSTEQIRIPDFTGHELMLSDLEFLLPASFGPSIEIDGVKVIQSPFETYPREKPLYAYVQVYNLVKDLSGKAAISTQWTLAPKDDPEEVTVIAEGKRDLTDDSRAEFQMLDIKRFDTGVYTLTVSVTDKKRVQTVTRSQEIEITK